VLTYHDVIEKALMQAPCVRYCSSMRLEGHLDWLVKRQCESFITLDHSMALWVKRVALRAHPNRASPPSQTIISAVT